MESLGNITQISEYISIGTIGYNIIQMWSAKESAI